MLLAFLPSTVAWSGSQRTIELLMIDDPACHYCRKWDREVGGSYAKSAEGRRAPLLRVRRGAPQLRDFDPVIYTPTFILVVRGSEVGRITGYPGRYYFWEELVALLAQTGASNAAQGGQP